MQLLDAEAPQSRPNQGRCVFRVMVAMTAACDVLGALQVTYVKQVVAACLSIAAQRKGGEARQLAEFRGHR